MLAASRILFGSIRASVLGTVFADREAPDTSTFEKLRSDVAVQEYIRQYNELVEKCLDGDLGKPLQY